MCRFFFIIGILMTLPVFGTDCETDCDRACGNSYRVWDPIKFAWKNVSFIDPVCRARCLAEKDLACRTGITSCHSWAAGSRELYFGAVRAVSESSMRTGEPADANACHAAVDQIVKGAGAVQSARFAYAVMQNARAAAQAVLSNATIVNYIVSRAVEHFAHCVCTEAAYGQQAVTPGGENQIAGPPRENDLFFVNRLKGLEWTLRLGPAENQVRLEQEASDAVGGSSLGLSGFFNSWSETHTEAICQKESRSASGTGAESLHAVGRMLDGSKLQACYIRTRNGPLPAGVEDLVIYSGRRSPQWAVGYTYRSAGQAGMDYAASLVAKQIGDRPTEAKVKIISSSRPVRTYTTCGRLDGRGGGAAFETEGKGIESINKAITKINELRAQGIGSCLLEPYDVGFAP